MAVNPKVREALKQALETQGREFVYSPGGDLGCYYQALTEADWEEDDRQGVTPFSTHEEDPRSKTGCLVGTALDILGWNHEPVYPDGIYSYAMEFIPELQGDDVIYLGIAQRAQDQGKTWGEAFDLAEGDIDG